MMLKLTKMIAWMIQLIAFQSFRLDLDSVVVVDAAVFVQKTIVPKLFSSPSTNNERIVCYTKFVSKRWMMTTTSSSAKTSQKKSGSRSELSKGLHRNWLGSSSQNRIFQQTKSEKSTKPGFLSMQEQHSTSISSSDRYDNKEPKAFPWIKLDGSFKDLVTESTMFADKTLFIKTVIEDSTTCLLITMPRRWGKSVNLDMLKRFLEISVDDSGEPLSRENTENYKLFAGGQIDGGIGQKSVLSPLKIANTKLFKKINALDVQGCFPVIYFDFKNCQAEDYNSIKKEIRAELSECFSTHAYLQHSRKLSISQRNLVTQYIEENDDAPIARGLKVLSKLLHQHHDKKVWILIDEYDAVINAVYLDPYFTDFDLRSTIMLCRGLYQKALQGNEYLEKAIITGTQLCAKAIVGTALDKCWVIDITTPQYAPYYGLSQEELEEFCEHFGVPTKYLDSVKQWYTGYCVQVYDHEKYKFLDTIDNKYNVWSVMNYLASADFKRFKSYWAESSCLDFLQNVISSPDIRNRIEELVDHNYGKSGTIVFNRERFFDDTDFIILQEMIIGSNTVVGVQSINILFSYLFVLGYLTMDGFNHNSYRIPNMEIKYKMGKTLIEYYNTICTIDTENIRRLIYLLQTVLSVKDHDHIKGLVKTFYDEFKQLLQGIRLRDDKEDADIITCEETAHTILNYILLQMQQFIIGSKFHTSKLHSEKKGMAIIQITFEDVGIVLVVKCEPTQVCKDGDVKEAMQQALSHGNFLNTKNNIFLAINTKRNMITQEEISIELLCALHMFQVQNVFGIDILGNEDPLVSIDFGNNYGAL